MSDSPRFSVITTVYDPEPDHLAAMFSSVDDQTYDGVIEHVVVDDASTRGDVSAVLDTAALRPGRRVIRRTENGGIVAASNHALHHASGEYLVLLDHDDVLAPDAIEVMCEQIDRHAPAVLYSDHDLLRADGRCASPVFKPQFSLERLRNHNYITHLVVARRDVVNDVGGFATGTDGAQDHDLLLRLAERHAPFLHVPEVLLHWRQSPRSVATSPANKPEATSRQCVVVAGHLARVGIDAAAEPTPLAGVVRIRRAIGEPRPTVSLIIPTNGATGRPWGVERRLVLGAVESVLNGTDGVDIEVVAVVDAGTDPVVRRGLHAVAGDALTWVDYDADYNFADKINVGVAASAGEYVLLLNDDTELIAERSIEEMVGLAQQPDVGMVGAKLLFADGTLQHGGHVYNGTISHAMLGWPGDHPGPNRMLAVERECSGVTAGAALLRRSVFDEVGGMDDSFVVNYNDVDFSLRIRAAGYRIIWTPHAQWFHFEQQSGEHPIDPTDIERIQHRWGSRLDDDPYGNPNLAPGRTDWLERPGLSGAPPFEVLADGRISWG